jgi:hypothetical protein
VHEPGDDVEGFPGRAADGDLREEAQLLLAEEECEGHPREIACPER